MRSLRGSVGCLAVVLAAMGGCADSGPEARKRVDGTPGQERSALVASTPELVRDISPSSPSSTPTSEPREFVWAGDRLFFSAEEAVHGRELWVSDGASAGTRLVLDLKPGAEGSLPSQLTPGRQGLYFLADDGQGKRLWVSDGTPGGTRPLVSHGSLLFPTQKALVATGGTLFFSADDELWKSNGTPEGTVRVMDPNPAGISRLELLKGVDGTLFFVADDGVSGPGLWKSDGTPEGTVPLLSLVTPDGREIRVRDSEQLGATFFFVLDLPPSPTVTRELWKSDGTPGGTVRLKSFFNVPVSPHYDLVFEDLTAVSGTLFFTGYDDWNGPHLWKSDGTEAGTVLVMSPSLPARWWFEPKFLLEAGGLLYFTAQTPEAGGDPSTSAYDLWKSDGTPEGTVRLTDFPGSGLEAPECIPAGRVGSRLIFTAYKHSEPRYRELWTTDGTPRGNVKLRAFKPEFPGIFVWSSGSSEQAFFFAGDDEVHGREPWRTDGTPEGTVLLRDVEAADEGAHQDLMDLAGTLLFLAEGDRHQGLWKTDGSAAGTVRLGDGFQQVRSGFQNLGRVAYFTATTPETGAELWRSDGTPAGTFLVKDLAPGAEGSHPGPGVVLGGRLVFSATTSSSTTYADRELWTTDGTAAGTTLLKDIHPGLLGSHPSTPVKVGGSLYFAANDGVSGEELWKTDGTPAGTVRVKDLVPGAASSRPRELVEFNGSLVFVADTSSGPAMWMLNPDGSLREILFANNGTQRYPIEKLTVVNGRLFCFTDHGYSASLRVYDGTFAAVPLLPAGTLRSVTHVARAGRVLFFRASDPEHGFELWRSDGTASGTWRVKDVLPGPGWGVDDSPLWGLEDRGVVFFRATDGVHGSELWVSDGSEQGTRPVADLAPGPWSSEPRGLVRSGDGVFFRADDGTPGTELWRVRLDPALPDTTPPALVCPAAVTLEAVSANGAYAYWPDARVSDVSTAPVPVKYSGVEGGIVPLGTTVVTATARDEAGNEATCSFDVTVRDTTAPVVSCPADVEVEALRHEGTHVSFPEARVRDWVTAHPEVTYSHASGSVFPVGVTPVTVTAKDAAGNTGTCAFRVTVKDTRAPLLTCPDDALRVEAVSAAGAPVTYAVAATDYASPVTVTYSPASGSTFPLGTTSVTATARDSAGNAASCSFLVLVRDTTAPSVTCPAGVMVDATGPSGALVTFAAATATDAVTASPQLTYYPASGSLFPVGTTTVGVTAWDAMHNAATCSFSVTVRDTTAPTLTCPASITAEATGATGAPVTFAASATDNGTASPEVTYSHAPGSAFPVGETSVTVTAKDLEGNADSCSFSVVVRDTTAPTISCPADVAVETRDASGSAVEYPAASVGDAVTAEPQVAYSHASGSLFPVGTTPVTATVTDAAGHTASCSFHVTVSQVPGPAEEGSGDGSGCASAGGSPAGLLGLLLLLAWPSLGRARARRS